MIASPVVSYAAAGPSARDTVAAHETRRAALLQRAEPCQYLAPGGYSKPGFDEFYELQNAGYAKPVPLTKAVSDFNVLARCSAIGRRQPPLTVTEVVAALRAWRCDAEPSVAPRQTCEQMREIARTGTVPVGGLLVEIGGVSDYRGYSVDAWEVHLKLGLDRDRRDTKGAADHSRLIRLAYIRSMPSDARAPKRAQ
ncbi:hypothetical protein [Roseisolibacter agri]|uniref:hypothetical protein n=1 Tax=Roseisolibacter agri TaxID=2014610 RepID=UPI0024E14D85|nr:hypothetical protein [Roseisolibacter agri]